VEVELYLFLYAEQNVNDSLTPHPLYPLGKSPNIHCTGSLWAPEHVWTFWRIQNLLSLPVFETRIIEPVA